MLMPYPDSSMPSIDPTLDSANYLCPAITKVFIESFVSNMRVRNHFYLDRTCFEYVI